MLFPKLGPHFTSNVACAAVSRLQHTLETGDQSPTLSTYVKATLRHAQFQTVHIVQDTRVIEVLSPLLLSFSTIHMNNLLVALQTSNDATSTVRGSFDLQ
jgi:hypothetical protein